MAERFVAAASPPGLAVERFADYLDAVAPELLTPPYRAKLIAGGKSNLTYLVSDHTGREVVVRRPPLAHVLATAHDMAREYRVIAALATSVVPVPVVHCLCTDVSVLGAPFYVMSKVDGVAYRERAQLAHLDASRVREMCGAMIEVLVSLHSIDPGDVGLAELGRPAGYLHRQVKRWRTQLDQSRSRALPGLAELYRLLAAAVPAESRTAIVHGDYRLDNLLLVAGVASPRVTAVLDWELATLGDPLMDLAMVVAHSREETESPTGPDGVATAPGFLSADELVSLYGRLSGQPVARFGFYAALAFFKMVGILEGIHFRSLAEPAMGIPYRSAGARVPWLIEAGLDALSR